MNGEVVRTKNAHSEEGDSARADTGDASHMLVINGLLLLAFLGMVFMGVLLVLNAGLPS
jgi:hypothetical protein